MINKLDALEGLLLLFSTEETNITEPWYKDFLYGIEEEGIPLYCVDSKEECLQEQTATCLANTSACYCCFDLGIGVDDKSLIIRHRLQKNTEPLLQIFRKDATSNEIRQLGHNTARIIKSLPLIL